MPIRFWMEQKALYGTSWYFMNNAIYKLISHDIKIPSVFFLLKYVVFGLKYAVFDIVEKSFLKNQSMNTGGSNHRILKPSFCKSTSKNYSPSFPMK
jgi:hypothetical protein